MDQVVDSFVIVNQSNGNRIILKTKKVLITGAGGFIGKSLVRKALSLGAKVTALEIDPSKAERLRAEFKIDVILGSLLDHNNSLEWRGHCDSYCSNYERIWFHGRVS
jgi:nucleoside-diphosphate-sugar epimerase